MAEELDKGVSRNLKVIGIIVASAALVVAGVVVFLKTRNQDNLGSEVAINTRQTSARPSEASPRYNELIDQHNKQEGAAAVEKEVSFFPVVTDKKKNIQPAEVPPPAQPAPQQVQVVQQHVVMNGGLQAQVDALMRAWAPPGAPVKVTVEAAQKQAAQPSQAVAQEGQQSAQKRSLLGKTPIVAAVLETAINTDEPSMVIATVTSGPLSGSMVYGEAKRVNEVVDVKFSSLYYNGKFIQVNGRAIDQDTMRSALAGDVDHKYFARYGLPILLGLVTGYATGMANAGSVIALSPFGGATQTFNAPNNRQIVSQAVATGAQQAASTYSQQNQSNSQIAVNIPQGTAIGIIFTTDVVEQ